MGVKAPHIKSCQKKSKKTGEKCNKDFRIAIRAVEASNMSRAPACPQGMVKMDGRTGRHHGPYLISAFAKRKS